jgi:anti-sigma B factor antagonist
MRRPTKEAHVEDGFGISEETKDGRSVISVVGELDVATAPDLRSRLDEAIDGGSSVVIADLLGVTFLDSTALGVLIGALKKCQAAGGDLRIVISEPRIVKVFEITGLTDLFTLFPTLEEAGAG